MNEHDVREKIRAMLIDAAVFGRGFGSAAARDGIAPNTPEEVARYILECHKDVPAVLAALGAPEEPSAPAAEGEREEEITPERKALVLDSLYRWAAEDARALLDEIDALRLPAHMCEPIADFSPYMHTGPHVGERRWWIGRLTTPIEGFPQEKWCFHIKTPIKPEIVFGFNEADLNYLVAMAYAALGYHTSLDWVETIAASARRAGFTYSPQEDT